MLRHIVQILATNYGKLLVQNKFYDCYLLPWHVDKFCSNKHSWQENLVTQYSPQKHITAEPGKLFRIFDNTPKTEGRDFSRMCAKKEMEIFPYFPKHTQNWIQMHRNFMLQHTTWKHIHSFVTLQVSGWSNLCISGCSQLKNIAAQNGAISRWFIWNEKTCVNPFLIPPLRASPFNCHLHPF